MHWQKCRICTVYLLNLQGLGVVRGGPVRKGLGGLRASAGYASSSTTAAAAAAAADKKKESSIMVPRGGQRSPIIGRNSFSRSNNAT